MFYRKLLGDFSTVSSSILEALAVIDIPEDDLSKARTIAIDNMSMIDQKDFPAFIAFLFKNDVDVLKDVSLQNKILT